MACALTTLAHVKEWLGIKPEQTGSDELIQRLIQSASRFILSYIQKQTVCVREYIEYYDGNGRDWMLLKQWPIQSIASIAFRGGPTITTQLVGTQSGSGFIINPLDTPDEGPQRITLWGYYFPRGRDTVVVTYTAGWKQTDELEIIQAGTDPDFYYTVAGLTQTWAGDIEVLDGDTPMTKVAANPAAGEYTVSDTGEYRFDAADVGKTVSVVYSFVPADLEQAAYELISEGIRYKDRIGVKSKTLGGQETIVYDNSWVNERIGALLQNYRRVAPL